MNVRVYVENPKRRFCLKTRYGNETILEVNQDSPHLLCHRSAYFDVTCRSPNGMKLNVCKNEHNFVKLEPFLTKSLFSNFRRSTTPTNARGKLLRPHLSQKCREGDSQCPSPSPPPSPPPSPLASHLLLLLLLLLLLTYFSTPIYKLEVFVCIWIFTPEMQKAI